MAWQLEPTGTGQKLLGVWCGDDDVLAVGAHGTLMRRGPEGWARSDSGTEQDLYAISGNSNEMIIVGGDLHVGGNSLVIHREAGVWIQEPSGMQHILLAVCPGPDGWVACGYNGAVIRGTPGAWHREDVVHYLHAFAACSAGQFIFVGGLAGSVIVFDGSSWSAQSTPTHQHLRGLAAASPDHVMAVGLEGKILRFDGEAWTEMHSPTREHLEGVWLEDAGHGYAVGYGGTLLEYDGRRWTSVPSGTNRNLHAVHGDVHAVVAVGDGGAACRLER